MKIRQEESTPIGDFYHDSGILKASEELASKIDKFEVETTELVSLCDFLVSSVKSLKAKIIAIEKETQKKQMQEKFMEKASNRYDF